MFMSSCLLLSDLSSLTLEAPVVRVIETWTEDGIGKEVVAIEAGVSSSFAILDDGSLWGWGGNFSGVLGDGTTEHRHRPEWIGDDLSDQTTYNV